MGRDICNYSYSTVAGGPGGYDPSDARSSRAGDAAAVAELAMQRLVVPPYAGSSSVSRLKISFF